MSDKTPETIDLTAADYQTVQALLRRYLPDVEVWAYGSRVQFTARPASDLDLVAHAAPAQAAAVSALQEALEESNLPFRTDLFVWDAIPEQFQKNIMAKHVALQKAGDGEAPRPAQTS